MQIVNANYFTFSVTGKAKAIISDKITVIPRLTSDTANEFFG